ncbi:twin-arginine translocation signal domain-containing protein [Myxococcus sp. XM-1-1-1]|nr:twin-arginine translocation signal domain-containing protein [Myxococcus sp. AS-1-15]MBZ4412830.1 twin-arginine translocation signal domain-containing protein [Myxococcus sp. XM-1-1-1]
MHQSNRPSMNRRSFLRAGAVLGMGAGGVLPVLPSKAWAAEGSDLPAPTGPYGVPPSPGRGYQTRPRIGPNRFNTAYEPPGIIQGVPTASPDLMTQPLLGSLDGETKASNRQVRFRNTYGSFIWICIAFPATAACGGSLGGHLTRGWWGIGLNQEVHVLTTQESWVYFMAEADDGAGWGGDALTACIPGDGSAFDHCKEQCLFGDRRVGMRARTFSSDVVITLSR